MELDNGMYAILIPDTMEMDGNKWAVVSAKQLGAVENGTVSDQTNLGILDFYCRGEENITVKNCELYDNARDEQVGIFTGVNNRDASFGKNVDFIDNKIYSYTPLNQEAGNCQSEKYVDKEVKNGTTYVYKAEAFVKDEDGEVYAGEMSDECTVTVEEQTTEPASEDTTEPTSSEPASEDTTEPISNEPTSEEPTEKPTSSSVKNKKVSGFKMKKCTTSTVTFKWKKLKGISGYEISVYKNKKWTVVGKSSSKATTKTIKKLAKGTKYKFRIRGYKKSSGKKIYTKSVTCKVVTRPAKIKIKTVKRYTTKAKIRWNKIKASGYEIKYSTSKNFKNSKKVLINKKNVTGKMVTNLKKKKYYFKVRSYVLLNGKKYYGSYSKVKRI